MEIRKFGSNMANVKGKFYFGWGENLEGDFVKRTEHPYWLWSVFSTVIDVVVDLISYTDCAKQKPVGTANIPALPTTRRVYVHVATKSRLTKIRLAVSGLLVLLVQSSKRHASRRKQAVYE